MFIQKVFSKQLSIISNDTKKKIKNSSQLPDISQFKDHAHLWTDQNQLHKEFMDLLDNDKVVTTEELKKEQKKLLQIIKTYQADLNKNQTNEMDRVRLEGQIIHASHLWRAINNNV